MDLREFLRTIRRSWWVVVAVLAVFLIVGSGYTILQRPVYTATAQAYVAVSAGSSATDLSQGAVFTQQAVKTYAGVATSDVVLSRVVSDLHLDETALQLKDQVTAEAPVDTTLLDITVTDRSSQQAADIANSVTNNLSRAVRELTPETAGSSSSTVLLTRIDPAYAPSSPSSPNLLLNLGIAVVLGLLIGVGAAVLRQRMDTRIRSSADVRSVVASPVIGEIVFDPSARTHPLVSTGGDDSRRAEGFRTLRTNLQFLSYDDRGKSTVVTSSIAGEGKSVTTANLAIVMAEAGLRVVVIDADLRRPQLAAYFGLESQIGLTDVLIGSVALEGALQSWGANRLTVLPAGSIPPNPSELLQSEAMRVLLVELEQHFDAVLIDAPPLVPVSDAAILTRRTGGALLLAASGSTRKPELRRAAASLEQIGARVLGTVLTKVPQRGSSYGYERVEQPTTHDSRADTGSQRTVLTR